ncbi:hypothetical protein FACS189487_07410 [Campylobacterota bacterium]|nr:hypothetical protein FACS189487_07410 [Campylobacterota bacterium]
MIGIIFIVMGLFCFSMLFAFDNINNIEDIFNSIVSKMPKIQNGILGFLGTLLAHFLWIALIVNGIRFIISPSAIKPLYLRENGISYHRNITSRGRAAAFIFGTPHQEKIYYKDISDIRNTKYGLEIKTKEGAIHKISIFSEHDKQDIIKYIDEQREKYAAN